MKKIMGVMGPGKDANEADLESAYSIDELSAKLGYVTLTGGTSMGVMDAALKGAKDSDGETVAILIKDHKQECSEYADIAIVTGMGSARNNINVLSSDVVVAIGAKSVGTLSEIALALKAKRKCVVITADNKATIYLKSLNKDNLHIAENYIQAENIIKELAK